MAIDTEAAATTELAALADTDINWDRFFFFFFSTLNTLFSYICFLLYWIELSVVFEFQEFFFLLFLCLVLSSLIFVKKKVCFFDVKIHIFLIFSSGVKSILLYP